MPKIFSDPEETLSDVHRLATAIENINPDLQAVVNSDNDRSASLSIADKNAPESSQTAFDIARGRFTHSIEVADPNIKLDYKSTDEDYQRAATVMAHKAGFDLD